MDASWVTISIIIVLFVNSVGFLPLVGYGRCISERQMAVGNTAAGGILLGTAMLQMMSSAEHKPSFDPDGQDTGFPYIHFAASMGFIVTFIIQHGCVFNCRKKQKRDYTQLELVEMVVDGKETLITLQDAPKQPLVPEGTNNNSYVLLIIMCFESLLSGMALGMQSSVRSVIIMLVATSSHDWAESMALCIYMLKSGMSELMTGIMMCVYCAVCVFSIALGLLIRTSVDSETLAIVSSGFIAFVSGTFLYIGCMEMLAPEFRHDSKDKPIKLLATIGAFVFTSVLVYAIE
jgi:zinc transporter ZupT